VDDPGKLADTFGANLLELSIREKQELLEIFDPVDRLTRIAEKLTMLNIEIEPPIGVETISGNATEGFRLPFEVRAGFPDGTTEVMPPAMAPHKAQAMGVAPTAIPPVARSRIALARRKPEGCLPVEPHDERNESHEA
jgi:hypothetical protein